jgi:hypothetical protein
VNRRRRFLLGLIGLCGAVVGWRLVTGRTQDGIVAIVYKCVGYLKLDPAGVRQFALDLDAKHQISTSKLRLIAATAPVYSHMQFDGTGDRSEQFRFGEDSIVTSYLLSTDFFTMGCDENRVVRYVALFDAVRGCSNPFARPVLQTGT